MLPLSQRNIEPAERVDGYPVAGADDDRGGFGLNDSWTYDGVAWLQVIERKNRNLAPTAEEGLPCRARRAGRGGRRRFLLLAAPLHFADRGDPRVDEHNFLIARGVGVKLFMPAVKAVFDSVDE